MSEPIFVNGIGPPLAQLHADALEALALPSVLWLADAEEQAERDIIYLITEVYRLREVLVQIAEHPVVSESAIAADLCDWHCTINMVAAAKDALGVPA